MLSLRRAILVALSTTLLLGLAWGCSASSDGTPPQHLGGGGTSSIGEAGADATILRPDGSAEAGQGSLGLDALCGRAPRCIPDKPGECQNYQPAPALNDDASIAASPGSADGMVEGGLFDASDASAGGVGAGNGATPSTGGAGGSSGGAGTAGLGGGAGEGSVSRAHFSCQVLRMPDAPDSALADCALAGTGKINDPCLTSGDCGWDDERGALACVSYDQAGLCQPYCCKGDDTCAPGSYCAERPLRDALMNQQAQLGDDSAPSVMIPVCVPAENCDLSAPYPCPSGKVCTCKSGTACIVVRADGTTTCAVPGNGQAGDDCPCAWGYVCSHATNQCLKLCYTRSSATCGDGVCQSSADLPDGWGVCVGANGPSGG